MKRLPWLWPAIIVLSTVAAGLVTFVIMDAAVRPFIVLWFLFVCPGMSLVRFFRLEELVGELVLVLALSFAVDAIVAGVLLYAGRWSPTTILGILMGISLGGAILQIGSDPLVKLLRRTHVSTKLYYRACPILKGFALSRRVFARLPRANNFVCCVENARSAFSTQHTKSDERRRREQAIVMAIRQTHSVSLERTQILLCPCGSVDDRATGRFCPRCGKPKNEQASPELIPTSIQPLIDAYIRGLEPLCSHFYGIYIFGSIALGAFEEQKSDIDIIALTQGEWTGHELAQLKHIHTQLSQAYPFGKRLEILYVPLHDIGKSDTEIAPYPYCGRKGRFHSAGYYDLHALTWWIIRYKSIRLFGPERSALPLEVTWKDVLKGMSYYLDIYLVDKAKHPYLFLLDGWIWEVVPMLCRVLTTLEDSEICAKPLALKRWRERLPAPWHPLINEAWRIGYHPRMSSLYRSPIKRMREVLAFIEYVRERGGKALEASSMITPLGEGM